MSKQTAAPLPVVERSVKHEFTQSETNQLYVSFRQAYANVAAVESEKGKVE